MAETPQIMDLDGSRAGATNRAWTVQETRFSRIAPRDTGLVVTQNYDSTAGSSSKRLSGAKVVVQTFAIIASRLDEPPGREANEQARILDPQDILVRVQQLKTLKDGWLDGSGLAPSMDGLDWLAAALNKHYPVDLALPFIYPTPEGGVQLEWPFSPQEPSLQIDLNRKTGEWHALVDTDECELLDLNYEASWRKMIGRLAVMSGVA
jgi:hypothetical protein